MSNEIQIDDRTINPQHRYWQTFKTEMEKLPLDGCEGDHQHTIKVLTALPGIDLQSSLVVLAEHGGHGCDCEVIMNAIYGWEEQQFNR